MSAGEATGARRETNSRGGLPIAGSPAEAGEGRYDEEGSGFRTALDLQEEAARRRALPAGVEPALLVVAPEVGIKEAAKLWNTFLEFRDMILSDPACYDVISGRKEMNRTGATRLALPFGLSIEQREIEEGRVELADTGTFDYRYRVRVRVGKGARSVDGIGTCRLSEIAAVTAKGEEVPIGQREHFALTRAWTRATKRAIADILGGTEAD